MSRFNQKNSRSISKVSVPVHNTVNKAGAPAYKQDAKTEFASILLTSMMNDQFYRSASEVQKQIGSLLDSIDPEFAAKAAIFARDVIGMRSVTHCVAAELGARVKGVEWSKDFFNSVVVRPDDMCEIMGYFNTAGYGSYPNSMKKGFAKAFQKFDAYQLAKYKNSGAIKLVDVANICHPKATPALNALMKGSIEAPDTWEVNLSAGKKSRDQVWRDLIESGKMPYMALIKNLRNILEDCKGDLAFIKKVCEVITNEKMIAKSRLFPMRFVTAYKMLVENNRETSLVRNALSKAVDIAMSNVPVLEGENGSAILLDVSGSMNSRWSGAKGCAMQIVEVAALFAAMIMKRNPGTDLILFSDHAKRVNIKEDASTLGILEQIMNSTYGGGTNISAGIKMLQNKYDRIMILSDMQTWADYAWHGRGPITAFKEYQKKFNANNCKVYTFDFTGYGTAQFKDNAYQIAGFSEKIFNFMNAYEKGVGTMVSEIEKIKF